MNFQSIVRTPIVIGLLFLIGILAFAQTFYFPFVHDDVVFIQKNPSIQSFHLKEIFLRTNTAGSEKLINTYYRPLLDVFYRLEYRLFHLNPSGYHALNVLLHIGNASILMLILQMIFKNIYLAFAVALIFLIHPVQTEAVDCIVGSSNLLFAFLFLLSLFHYLKQDKSVLNYIYSLVFFLCALFTKEQAVMLPLILAGYEYWKGEKSSFQEKCKAISGHIVILCMYLLMRKMIFGHSGVDLGNLGELKLRLLSIPATLLMYLRILIVPSGLHYYRNTDILLPFIMPAIALAGLGVLLFFSLRQLARKERRMVYFGIGWFIVTLLPMLNILPLVDEYSFILTSEHFLYLPVIGFVMAGAGYFTHVEKQLKWQNKRSLILWGMIILTVVLFSMTVRQNYYWRSEVALFERMINFEKDFARGHQLLARAYYTDNQYDKSIQHYEKALERMSYYANRVSALEVKKFYESYMKEIYFEAAHVYLKIGRGDQAELYYKKLIDLDPNFSKAHINLGVYYAIHGNLEKAKESFIRATEIDPYDSSAWENLFTLYKQQNDTEGVRKAAEMIKRSFDHPK